MGRLSGFHDLFFLALWLSGGAQSAVLEVDKTRLEMGEAGLKELEGNAAHNPCWRAAVEKLDLSGWRVSGPFCQLATTSKLARRPLTHALQLFTFHPFPSLLILLCYREKSQFNFKTCEDRHQK